MILTFQSATLYRGAKKIVTGLNWDWRQGQHWLLTGPVGSGKTTIAEAITGRCRTSPGGLTFFQGGQPVSIYDVKKQIQYLAFSENTHKLRFGDVFYYQQRYQAMESESGLTVGEYLFGTHPRQIPEQLTPLNIDQLLDRRFIQLSNGQTRRVRLAKSLMQHPRMLILEEVFTGIDKQTTGIIEHMLQEEIARGTHLLLIGDYAPAFVTHVLQLSPEGAPIAQTRSDWMSGPGVSSVKADRLLPAELMRAPEQATDWAFVEAVRFTDVSITYQQKTILQSVNWVVRKGEKWMLNGPNGSGKSSLISLIFADNPQAYAQQISLFDRARGTGESIWDIKRKIGYLSPELQTYMHSRRNAVDIAAAGYSNTMVLSRKLNEAEIDRLRVLFDYFGIRALARTPFMELSAGEQRLVLFIRAVVNNAPVLVLDEPFHAMDEYYHRLCLQFLEAYCHDERTLIYISHLQEPPPVFITHELDLG